MVECTMVCLDFSDYMRNGDYYPNRLEAQRDAAQCIARAKTNSHPENSVGVLGMGPGGVKVLVSPTDDMGKLLASLSESTLGGEADIGAGVQVAKLALQHRKGRGAQRIIIFVGSPVGNEEKELTKIAKQLKKNNVAVDVVSIGEFGENEEKLKKLVDTANNQDNSHLVEVPAGSMPSEVLYSSPVLGGGGGAFGGTGDIGGVGTGSDGAQAFQEYGGVNPELDPELAMALRVSMQEARAVANKSAEDIPSESKTEEAKTEAVEPSDKSTTENEAAGGEAAPTTDVDMEVDDPVLAQALKMSMGDVDPGDEDDLLAKALQMSMQPEGGDNAEESSSAGTNEKTSNEAAEKVESVQPPAEEAKEAAQLVVNKEDFEKMIADLPGVDISDPKIQDALNGIYSGNKDSNEKKEEDKKE